MKPAKAEIRITAAKKINKTIFIHLLNMPDIIA
jgi:hypothetical protein